MTTYGLDDRWKENLAVMTSLQRFSLFLIFIATITVIVGYQVQYAGWWAHIDWVVNAFRDFYANVSSELISIVITVLVVDRLNRAREQRDAETIQERLDAQELTRLKALMGSDEVVVTKIAVAELKAKGWLKDGSLGRANLHRANLQGTDLSETNLQGTDLSAANLQGTNLLDANLEGAYLIVANLQGANLVGANLQGTDLSAANLQGTNLQYAYLEGASLKKANLSDANLVGAYLEGTNLLDANLEHANMYYMQCDENITLPDGTKWTEDTDWTQFGAVVIGDLIEWEAYRKEHGLDKK